MVEFIWKFLIQQYALVGKHRESLQEDHSTIFKLSTSTNQMQYKLFYYSVQSYPDYLYTDPLYLVCCYKKRFVYIDPATHRVLMRIQVFLATVGAPPGSRHRRDHPVRFAPVKVRPPITRGISIMLGLERAVAGHAGQRDGA